MSQFVTAAHRETYRSHMRMALQQKTSKLLSTVTVIDASGEMHKIEDIVGQVQAQRKKTRHADTTYNNTPHDGRWIGQPEPIFYADLVDKEDKLASGIDIEGGYVKAGAAALNRGVDDAIIGAFYNTAQTGKKGTVLTPFDNSNIVPVATGGANTMNVQKLAAAQEVLRGNFVDLEDDELYVALTARQARNLLNDVTATSKDFGASGMEIREGKLTRLMGFNIVHIELGNPLFENSGLTFDAGNTRRRNPFWAKSCMVGAFWEREFTSVDQLPTKHFSAQVYARRIFDATRVEEGGVGFIENSEA
jgi:hypothetical protein